MKTSIATLAGAFASLTIMFNTVAHADYGIPLKANPILCAGTNEKLATSQVSVKVVTNLSGFYALEYAIDKQAPVKLESKYALELSYEGSLYIQTYDETSNVMLTVADGDISALNKDLKNNNAPLSKLAYRLSGRFQAHGEAFQVSCLGSFAKE